MRHPASGVLATALRPAVRGGVLRRLPDGFPRFPLPPPKAGRPGPQPFCPPGTRCPGAGAPAAGRCHCLHRRPAPLPAGGAGGSDPGSPRSPGALRSPLPSRRAARGPAEAIAAGHDPVAAAAGGNGHQQSPARQGWGVAGGVGGEWSTRIASQVPISSEELITPAHQGKHRQQQNQQGDADGRLGRWTFCSCDRTGRDQPGLSVPSALLSPSCASELAGECELVLSSNQRADSRPAFTYLSQACHST